MAQRFGRNRRRAAREAVAKAEREAASAKEFWSKLFYKEQLERSRAQQMLADVCERIARAVGPESGLIPLSLQMRQRVGTPIRWAITEGPDLDGFRLDDPRLTHFSVGEAKYRDLLALVMLVEKEPTRFDTCIRFVNENDGRNGAKFSERVYVCTEDYLRRIGAESDFRYFVEDVVHRLLTLQKGSAR